MLRSAWARGDTSGPSTMHISLITQTLAIALLSLQDVLKSVVELPVEIFRLYGDSIRWAADSVRSLFDSYGYWVVFFGTLCENVLFLGLLIPGVLVILLAGLSAHEGSLSLHWAFLFGIAGTIIGDTI